MKVANTTFQAKDHLWYYIFIYHANIWGRPFSKGGRMMRTSWWLWHIDQLHVVFPFLRMVFCATNIMTKQMTYSYTMHILWPFYAIIFKVMKTWSSFSSRGGERSVLHMYIGSNHCQPTIQGES
jgi:hypothetical protein